MIPTLITLPFAALALLIVFMSIMRGVRRLNQGLSTSSNFKMDSARRKPVDEFHDAVWLPLCTKVAQAAGGGLGRALTEKERRSIWRARTELVLEVAMKEIETAGDGQVVAILLENLPPGMDRPDPTKWCGVALTSAPATLPD